MNKKFLDDLGLAEVASIVNQKLKQVSEMPLASEELAGKIYQYIGNTTSLYTNGYFYGCEEVGGSYQWVRKNVQEDVPHVSGTYNEIQQKIANNEIPDGAYTGITDDYDSQVQVGVYSTTETKTGEIWIDGKPIYRKVYNVPNTSSTATWLQFNMNTPGFKEVVRWNGYSVAKATGHVHSGCQRLLGFAYYGGASYMGGVTVYGPTHATMANTIGVFEGNDLAAETDHYIIILEYTKTTD